MTRLKYMPELELLAWNIRGVLIDIENNGGKIDAVCIASLNKTMGHMFEMAKEERAVMRDAPNPNLQVPVAPHATAGIGPTPMRPATAEEAARYAKTPTPLTNAARDVLAERERQKTVEGANEEHDNQYHNHELARAAAFYAYPELTTMVSAKTWPWAWSWFKPKDRRTNVVRAGALILAEIELCDRRNQPRSIKPMMT